MPWLKHDDPGVNFKEHYVLQPRRREIWPYFLGAAIAIAGKWIIHNPWAWQSIWHWIRSA
jgi:hypothetical protein